MQIILNNLYETLDEFFSQFNSFHMPSWVNDIVPLMSDSLQKINYFAPLDTFFSVAMTVVNFHILMIVFSFILHKKAK